MITDASCPWKLWVAPFQEHLTPLPHSLLIPTIYFTHGSHTLLFPQEGTSLWTCRGCPWWLCSSPPSLINGEKRGQVLKCSILKIITFLQEKYYLITHQRNLSKRSVSVWVHKHGKYFISLRTTFVAIDQLGPHCAGGGHSLFWDADSTNNAVLNNSCEHHTLGIQLGVNQP